MIFSRIHTSVEDVAKEHKIFLVNFMIFLVVLCVFLQFLVVFGKHINKFNTTIICGIKLKCLFMLKCEFLGGFLRLFGFVYEVL